MLSRQTQAELMIAEDRERMIELCRRIAMETDSKRLALWIEDLNQIIKRKIDELKKATAVEQPSLIPAAIQTLVNRCCHKSARGKCFFPRGR